MNELYDSIKCLCNSPQRLQIIDTLDSTQMDLCSLKRELESPRTTLQRNLSELEQRGWVEETHSKYTATTAGCLILETVMMMEERIGRINDVVPFLEAVDAPAALDIGQLRDVLMTVPKPTQPNAPMRRLLNAFDGANRVRGCLPVVSWVLIERSQDVDEEVTTEYEYVVTQDALDALHNQYTRENGNVFEGTQSARIDIHIFESDLPYGLFIADDRLALAAYDEIGRIQALIESEHETTIEWGEQIYGNYRHQSRRLRERDIQRLIHDTGTTD